MEKQDRIQEMYDLVEQWHQSGMSQKQFSAEHNIKLPTFMYWVKKYRMNKQDDPGFARVECIPPTNPVFPVLGNDLILPGQKCVPLLSLDGRQEGFKAIVKWIEFYNFKFCGSRSANLLAGYSGITSRTFLSHW